MQTRRLQNEDFEQVKRVWIECFSDSDRFVDEYFNGVAKITDGKGVFFGEELVSDMFTIDFTSSLANHLYKTKFIAGCATVKKARNRHLMKNLIREYLIEMLENNISICYLHPFLHSFYRKLGFETVSYVTQHTDIGETSKNAGIIYNSIKNLPIDKMFLAYCKYIGDFDNHFVRDKNRFASWIKLLFADGGKAVIYSDTEELSYALFYEEEGKNNIFEIVYFTNEQLNSLVSTFNNPYEFNLPCKAEENGAKEFTMMRILNPIEVLKNYTFGSNVDKFVVHISDDFLQKEYNLLVQPNNFNTVVEHINAKSEINLNINELAILIAGSHTKELYSETNFIFNFKKSCYFETY